jgi:uncharacterized membrane protein YdjX (TVP38/TMEM64 family)
MMIQKGKMNTFWKPAVLVVLLVAGFIAGRFGLVDWEWVFRQSERLAGNWWAPPAVIAAMSAFYLFGLPGSVFIWIAGLLYHPAPATLIITAGGVIGGTGAAVFSRKMAGSPEERPQADPALLRFMARHSDVTTLFAIRAMPFFPHSMINYGAGVLGIHLGTFAVASAFGFAAKGFVYASAIHGAAEADEIADLLDAAVFYPLLALAVLLVAGRALHRRWLSRDDAAE